MPHLIAICSAVNYRSPIPSRLPPRGIPVSDEAGLMLRREAVFGAATRHSRLVALLRKFIPVFLGGSVVLTGLWLWLDPFKAASELPVSIGKITIEGSKLKMEAPKLTGFSKDGQPYNVTAESALQDLKKPGVIELFHIIGHFSLGNRKTVLNAKSGIYDAKADKMRVFNGIDFQSDDGQGGRLSEATIETKKGHLITDKPVDLYFKDGTLRGNTMEVFDHGKVIVFEGDVRMELHSDSQTAAVPPETATQ
jgi:lipopolysaccharide export system protein LptC